jgi:hypothetical protein
VTENWFHIVTVHFFNESLNLSETERLRLPASRIPCKNLKGIASYGDGSVNRLVNGARDRNVKPNPQLNSLRLCNCPLHIHIEVKYNCSSQISIQSKKRHFEHLKDNED